MIPLIIPSAINNSPALWIYMQIQARMAYALQEIAAGNNCEPDNIGKDAAKH